MALAAEAIQTSYVPLNAYPEIAQARLEGRREAYEILETNRQNLLAGEFESVPIPVDALGTARRVHEAEALYGKDSPERQERFAGLVLDCNRLFAEAKRINTWEYFEPIRLTRDEQTGDYYSHGQSVRGMTESGLSPVAESEESDRRVNEHVEEITHITIGRLGHVALGQTVALEQPVKVRTISECAEWAIEAYENRRDDQPRGGYGGYAPQIEKFMIRDVMTNPESRDRDEEQMGLSGEYITHEVIQESLARRDMTEGTASKTELHGNQMLVTDDMMEFVALLDSVASEKSGQEIYLGEVLPAGKQRNYGNVREEARGRQRALGNNAYELAEFVMALEEDETDRWAALGLVEAEVKRVLIEMADKDNSLAADMFDAKTKQGLQEVTYLRSIGQQEAAEQRLAQVAEQAPSPGFCGAGSCGLESVEVGSVEAKKMKEMGLNSSESLRDTERGCRECGKKTVVYDLKNKKKGCIDCGATTKY